MFYENLQVQEHQPLAWRLIGAVIQPLRWADLTPMSFLSWGNAIEDDGSLWCQFLRLLATSFRLAVSHRWALLS